MTAINFRRNPLVMIVQMVLNVLLGFILGAIFWNLPAKGPVEISGRNMLGCLFFLVTHLVFTPLDCLSLFAEDRELFNRDTANGNYTPLAYFLAKSLASMPFQHTPLTMVLIISYWMVGMSADVWRFLIFLLIGQVTIFASTSFLFLAAAVCKKEQRQSLSPAAAAAAPRLSVAQCFAPILMIILLLVSGYYIREQDIPGWIRWLKYVSFFHYPYICVAANEFKNNPTWSGLPDDFLAIDGGLSDTRLWTNFGILTVLAVTLRVMAFFALKSCNRRIGLEA